MKTETHKDIAGVRIHAVRATKRGAGGQSYWVAQIGATGACLPQHYATRPELWAHLERAAQACGAEKFFRDCMAAR